MLRDEKANGPRIRNSPFRASYELRGDKLNTSDKATRTEVVLCALFPLIYRSRRLSLLPRPSPPLLLP